MACASCAKKKPNSYQDMKALETPPFRASDIIVYDIESGEHRKFENADWNTKGINVLLFVQNVQSIKEINITPAQEGVNFTYVTNQPIHQIADYYDNGGEKPVQGRIFASYLLPSRTNLLFNGSTKKAVVYVMEDGDFAIQQLFYNSSFNYQAIADFLEDYFDGDNN